jgi:hypothetical protein
MKRLCQPVLFLFLEDLRPGKHVFFWLVVSDAIASPAGVEALLGVVVPPERWSWPSWGTGSVVIPEVASNTAGIDGATVTRLVVTVLETNAAGYASRSGCITRLSFFVAVASGTGLITLLSVIVPDGSRSTVQEVDSFRIAVGNGAATETPLVETIWTSAAIVNAPRSGPWTWSSSISCVQSFQSFHFIRLRRGK